MKENEKLKQLKMALTNHKDLIVFYDKEPWVKLTWNGKSYSGISLKTNLEIGIWTIEFLLEIINREVEHTTLEVANG